MNIDQAFEQGNIITAKLKEYLRDSGYTKASFSKKAEISCTDLDNLLENRISDKDVFDNLLKVSLAILDAPLDAVLSYSTSPIKPLLISNEIPDHIKASIITQKQYNLLLDILSLCEIYY